MVVKMNGIDGIDGIMNKLEQLKENVKKIEGEHQISLEDLLNTSFMNKYTNLENAQHFIDGCEKACNEGFLELDDDNSMFTRYIKANTTFDNWPEMLNKAHIEWITTQIDI